MSKNKTEQEINNKFQSYTDLAIETAEMIDDELKFSEDDGITLETTNHDFKNQIIKVTHVKIINEKGVKLMGKPIGNYITVETSTMKENDILSHEEIVKILVDKLTSLNKLSENTKILIVGLGNWNITPDALGPKVISKTLVTSHLMGDLPYELVGKVREVSAISPGVMGITGIETGEIIKGIVDRTSPDLVIAIDALAARESNRVNSTIQISDTGITPGGGVGNKRMALTMETLGVPVIAIGVPTVVDAATLINDSIELIIKRMISHAEEGSEFYKMLDKLESDEKYNLIKNVLDPYMGNMIVTPKEVDAVVERLSSIIANMLNISLHSGISKDDMNRYGIGN